MKSKWNYFLYNLKWWNWEKLKFQFYLWSIGGINAGYWLRPNDHYYKVRSVLFDLWNWLFVKKIHYDGKFGKVDYYDDEGQRNNPFRQKLSIRGLFCSPGWNKLIMNLIKELVKAGWNKELCDCKQKYGGLRFYTGGCTDEQWKIIDKYESMSYDTCEYCGSTENIGQTEGWITTMCKNCVTDENWKQYETKN